MESSPSPQRSPLKVLLLTLYLDLVGFSIFFPMYAEMMHWYAGADSGLLSTWASFMTSVFGIGEGARLEAFFGASLGGLYAIGQFLVTPAWGRLSDRIGRRKVLLCTIGLNLIGYLAWMLAGSFEILLLSRIIGALAAGNIGVASAAVADLSTKANRARSMGLMGAVIGLGFITGPVLGSLYVFLPTLGDTQSGWGLHPFSVPAVIAAALTLFNLIWLWRRFEEPRKDPATGPAPVARSANPLKIFSKDLGVLVGRMSLAYLFFTIVFAGYESTLVFLAFSQLNWGAAEIGPFMALIGFVSAMIQGGLIRRLAPKVGERPLAIFGLLAFVPGLVLIALVPSSDGALFFVVGGLLLGVGVGFFAPTAATLASLGAPEGTQGIAMGRYRSAGALGRAIGPLLAGILYFRFGPEAPYLAGLIFLVPALYLMWRAPLPPRDAAAGD